MASSLENIRKAQRASGTATILAIGTATPPNSFEQAHYADFYFRATKSENRTDLKDKMKRICERSMIKKRQLYVTEEILQKNPNFYDNTISSLDTRREMLVSEVPKLGKEAALKAIKDWGRPISDITHLVFATSSGTVDMPSSDYNFINLLGLRPNVMRFMLFQHGCYAGGAALRLAKDLAENNAGARVLVVCVDSTAICFTGPSENHLDRLVGQAIFGDGAAAAIVGADSNSDADERPLFRMAAAAQTIIPNSADALYGNLTEKGLAYSLSAQIPFHIGSNIGKSMEKALAPLGISDWNSVFYVVHPGGPSILNQIEENLGLEPEKLRASRDVLREYGNMWGPTVFFILAEMRKKAIDQGMATTGEGLEWGVLFAFGPGLTVETIVLKSVAI